MSETKLVPDREVANVDGFKIYTIRRVSEAPAPEPTPTPGYTLVAPQATRPTARILVKPISPA